MFLEQVNEREHLFCGCDEQSETFLFCLCLSGCRATMMKHGALLKTTKATEKERGQIKVVRVDVQATTKVSGTATPPGRRWGRLKGG